MALSIDSKLRFHEPEEVAAYLRETLELADAAELEGEDRAALLPAIFSVLSQNHVQLVDQAQVAALGKQLIHGRQH